MKIFKAGDKHNWFEVNGDIRTKEKMTTHEFTALLDKLGLELRGRIAYSVLTDEDYRGE